MFFSMVSSTLLSVRYHAHGKLCYRVCVSLRIAVKPGSWLIRNNQAKQAVAQNFDITALQQCLKVGWTMADCSLKLIAGVLEHWMDDGRFSVAHSRLYMCMWLMQRSCSRSSSWAPVVHRHMVFAPDGDTGRISTLAHLSF